MDLESLQSQVQAVQKHMQTRRTSNTRWEVGEKLNALLADVLATVTAKERELLESLSTPIEIRKDAPYTVDTHDALLLCDQMLAAMANSLPANTGTNSSIGSRKVFVVHGHDTAAREQVARFIEKLKLTPIILHEQPNQGHTIIEKFTDYSDVGFAVVLLTADDVGGVKGSTAKQLSPRARQNVVFELGYFIGRLGRSKVCALHESSVEILSDYNGVVYISLDSHGAWAMQLAKELRAAGLPVDMNDAV